MVLFLALFHLLLHISIEATAHAISASRSLHAASYSHARIARPENPIARVSRPRMSIRMQAAPQLPDFPTEIFVPSVDLGSTSPPGGTPPFFPMVHDHDFGGFGGVSTLLNVDFDRAREKNDDENSYLQLEVPPSEDESEIHLHSESEYQEPFFSECSGAPRPCSLIEEALNYCQEKLQSFLHVDTGLCGLKLKKLRKLISKLSYKAMWNQKRTISQKERNLLQMMKLGLSTLFQEPGSLRLHEPFAKLLDYIQHQFEGISALKSAAAERDMAGFQKVSEEIDMMWLVADRALLENIGSSNAVEIMDYVLKHPRYRVEDIRERLPGESTAIFRMRALNERFKGSEKERRRLYAYAEALLSKKSELDAYELETFCLIHRRFSKALADTWFPALNSFFALAQQMHHPEVVSVLLSQFENTSINP